LNEYKKSLQDDETKKAADEEVYKQSKKELDNSINRIVSNALDMEFKDEITVNDEIKKAEDEEFKLAQDEELEKEANKELNDVYKMVTGNANKTPWPLSVSEQAKKGIQKDYNPELWKEKAVSKERDDNINSMVTGNPMMTPWPAEEEKQKDYTPELWKKKSGSDQTSSFERNYFDRKSDPTMQMDESLFETPMIPRAVS
jgi:hypothetical protein